MIKNKDGFDYDRVRVEKDEEDLNEYGNPKVFKFWYLDKDIVAIKRVN